MPKNTTPAPGASSSRRRSLRLKIRRSIANGGRELTRTAVLGVVKGAAIAAGSTLVSLILWWAQHN